MPAAGHASPRGPCHSPAPRRVRPTGRRRIARAKTSRRASPPESPAARGAMGKLNPPRGRSVSARQTASSADHRSASLDSGAASRRFAATVSATRADRCVTKTAASVMAWGGKSAGSRPVKRTRPCAGFSAPMASNKTVLLPLPLMPSSTTVSPGATDSETGAKRLLFATSNVTSCISSPVPVATGLAASDVGSAAPIAGRTRRAAWVIRPISGRARRTGATASPSARAAKTPMAAVATSIVPPYTKTIPDMRQPAVTSPHTMSSSSPINRSIWSNWRRACAALSKAPQVWTATCGNFP